MVRIEVDDQITKIDELIVLCYRNINLGCRFL